MAHALKEMNKPQIGLERARELVVEAMAELDRCGASADIAAHLDLAVHRIGHELGKL